MSQIKLDSPNCHRCCASTWHTFCSRPFLAPIVFRKRNDTEMHSASSSTFDGCWSSSEAQVQGSFYSLLLRGLPFVDSAWRLLGVLPLLTCVHAWVLLPVCTELLLFLSFNLYLLLSTFLVLLLQLVRVILLVGRLSQHGMNPWNSLERCYEA
jgi:hypothetical protein